jgi:hypothetical protein
VAPRPRPELPREFRRRANRPALSRRQLRKGKLDPELLATARHGVLTRTNTVKGSQGRQAVDRAKGYAPRAARTASGETVRARLGHAPAPEVVWSAIPTTSGVIEVLTTTRRESSRVGAYSHDVGLLLDGDLDPKDFERKWRRRRRDIGPDVELEWRAEVVIVLMAAAGPAPEPFYRRRRPPGGRAR